MITKHFFKILIIFIGIIVIGLIGVFLVGYFDKDGEQSKILNKALLIVK